MSQFQVLEEKVGPLTLRAWTVSTIARLEALRDQNYSEFEQAIAIAWMQSTPKKEVRAAFKNGSAPDLIADFVDDVPLDIAKPLAEWCKRQLEAMNNEKVEVIARTEPDPDQPPN